MVKALEWYHENLLHPGARRLEESIMTNFTCPTLFQICKEIASKCDICSEMKLTNVVKDGKMALKEDKQIKPWDLLSVDLCEPWTVKCNFEEPQHIQEVRIWALTMIDKGSNWSEIASIENKYTEEIVEVVDDYWISRYPRPL